ncbi:MAG TPA: hypothetical protein VKR38_16520 [Usitatibacter sp.]|nr:hypothetical protein [Usitatibacter sp.]
MIAAVLLVSCGGGGAKNNPNQGGTLALLPSGGTFYAGVAYTMTLSGGHGPYSLSSDEADVLPVPAIVNGNTFQVVANNPGVIDTGLPPGALPVRTVNITARDSTGQGPITAAIKVAQNFLTSYTLSFPTTTCTLPTTITTISPCAGGDTLAQVQATVNGNLQGLMEFRFDVVSGTMGFVNPLGSNTVTQSYTTQTDHQGTATAVVRVPAGTPAQIGMIRVTATASGVNTLYSFLIIPGAASPLTAIPSSFTFTGSGSSCGNGSGDFIVTGGTPPYKAQSSDPNIAVVQKDPTTFTLTYSNPNPPCATGSVIIVTDSAGSTPAQVTVTSTAGAAGGGASAVQASPTTITLASCGASAPITVVGGSGTYSATSTAPGYLGIAVSGGTVTVTRRADDLGAPPIAASQIINITDGTTNASVTATVPTTCP